MPTEMEPNREQKQVQVQEQKQVQEQVQGQVQEQGMPTQLNGAALDAQMPAAPKQEQVLMGVVGSFLFSLLGAVLYFLVYQTGFIAGACGLVSMILAIFGYQLFSGVKNSMKGIVTSVVMLVVSVLVAEYFCVSYEIYNAFKEDYAITFFDAVRATPDFIFDPESSELLLVCVKDVLIALALGAVASFNYVRAALVKSRAEKQQGDNLSQ